MKHVSKSTLALILLSFTFTHCSVVNSRQIELADGPEDRVRDDYGVPPEDLKKLVFEVYSDRSRAQHQHQPRSKSSARDPSGEVSICIDRVGIQFQMGDTLNLVDHEIRRGIVIDGNFRRLALGEIKLPAGARIGGLVWKIGRTGLCEHSIEVRKEGQLTARKEEFQTQFLTEKGALLVDRDLTLSFEVSKLYRDILRTQPQHIQRTLASFEGKISIAQD